MSAEICTGAGLSSSRNSPSNAYRPIPSPFTTLSTIPSSSVQAIFTGLTPEGATAAESRDPSSGDMVTSLQLPSGLYSTAATAEPSGEGQGLKSLPFCVRQRTFHFPDERSMKQMRELASSAQRSSLKVSLQ